MLPVRCNISMRSNKAHTRPSPKGVNVNTPQSGAGANGVDEVDLGLGQLKLSRDEDKLAKSKQVHTQKQVGASELDSYPRLGIEIEPVATSTPAKLKKALAPLALEPTGPGPAVVAWEKNIMDLDLQLPKAEAKIKMADLETKNDEEDSLWNVKELELHNVIELIVKGGRSNDENVELWEEFVGKWRPFFNTVWLHRT